MEGASRVPATRHGSVVLKRNLAERSSLARSSLSDPSKKDSAKECTMCGDVGFVNDLVLCKRCGYRFQHTYCSRLYPNLDMEGWACDWCLYEEEKLGASKTKLARRKASGGIESKRKAFEFLLQIAQADPGNTNFDAAPPLKRQRQEPHARASYSVNKNGNPNGSSQKQVLKEETIEEEPSTGKGTGNCTDESRPKPLVLQVSKKQRCGGERNKALGDSWRNVAKNKLFCNSTSTKVIGRRYKLLADVLC
eukprot:TRINITY_DN4910_c0_g1_i1.p1 TRINITY_DN4910_c0_g1~~TRINITY_DN4910_c0_g1_i1.p1  ORF type:complete len:250 (+),score=29.34 TRINITY_DN4910_c0_g1_i1:194-943(+)